MTYVRESGNVLIIILIGISLFAALAFAFTQGSRTNIGFIQNEMDRADNTKTAACDQAVASSIKRLQLRGCKDISYQTDPAAITNPSCAIYHTQGGGVAPCNTTITPPCTVTTIGELCPDGSAYAGISPDGGKRMYMAATESSQVWGASILRGATSTVSGKSNTIILANAGDPIGVYCKALTSHGNSDWYVPSRDEMAILYTNRTALRDAVGFYSITWENYWTSTETSYIAAYVQEGGGAMRDDYGKNASRLTRCIRTDP